MKTFVLMVGLFVHGEAEPRFVDPVYSFSSMDRCQHFAGVFNERSTTRYNSKPMMFAFACEVQDGYRVNEREA